MNDVLEILDLFNFYIFFNFFKYFFSPSTVMDFFFCHRATSPSLFRWETGLRNLNSVFSYRGINSYSGGQRLARGDNWFG